MHVLIPLSLLVGLSAGDTLTADGAFTCLRAGSRTTTPVSGFTEDVLVRGDQLIVAQGNRGVSLHALDDRELARIRVDARNLSLDGERLWVRGDDHGISVIDAAVFQLLGSYKKHPLFEALLKSGAPRAIVAREALLWVAWGGWIYLYEVENWEEPRLLARHPNNEAVTGLSFWGDVLLLELFSITTGAAQVSAWNAKRPTAPVVLFPARDGRLIRDGARVFLVEKHQVSELELHDDAPLTTRLVAPLKAHEWVTTIVDDRLFLRHDNVALTVLALPSLEFVAGVMGNFETGQSPSVRAGEGLFLSTRFGGLQRLDLDALRPAKPELRFAGQTIDRNRHHGDILFVTVQTGDSVARLLRRFELEDPARDWKQRMEPLVRLNQSAHPDLSRLREGDRVGLLLPRTLLCRP